MRRRVRRAYESRLWPVAATLLAAALLPPACVLWFMGEAMRNERLASRQKLLDAYRVPMEHIRARLQDDWRARIAQAGGSVPALEPAELFREQVVSGHCDSLVVYDADGALRYPQPGAETTPESAAVGPEWEAAEALEFETNDPRAALGLYTEIAQTSRQLDRVVRARIAAGRCMARLKLTDEAAEQLLEVVDHPAYQQVRDEDGRLMIADAGLLALEWLGPEHRLCDPLGRRLALLAADYRLSMPAAQRRLMMELLIPRAGPEAFPTYPAERLAASYLEGAPAPPARECLTREPHTGLWRLASADGIILLLYRPERVESKVAAALSNMDFSGASVRLLKPDEHAPEPFLVLPMDKPLPGWHLALYLGESGVFDDHARRRTLMYLCVGLAVALLTVVLILLVGRYVGRAVRLTRLKNDLIATVSHELKTPLASIRALVDTLLAADTRDPQQTREYLELISRENLRLSRMIDNFLAFSRMERNRQTFEFADVEPARIVAAACEAAGERFAAANCELTVDVAEGLPAIRADHDALVTALLNLMDNAWKYSGPDKRIAIEARMAGGQVRFEVSDNGIGLSRRAMRRIFDRFYQVDRSLSRQAGGCGLGLSIVKFIVQAHGGDVEVRSRPGEGSTFVVAIPASPGGERHQHATRAGSREAETCAPGKPR